MDLTLYDIILGPVITDKASKLINKLKKVVLEVHPKANKPLVKEALEKLFNVKVKSVRIKVRKGKIRRFRRIENVGTLSKHAIVTLKDNHSFDILTQSGAGGIAPEQAVNASTSTTETAS